MRLCIVYDFLLFHHDLHVLCILNFMHVSQQEKLSQKLSSMRNTQSDMESKIRLLEEERDLLRTELGQTKQDTGTAKNEMEVMKGVAFQQTTQTYEKNMKLQTQLLEMQASYINRINNYYSNTCTMYMYVMYMYAQCKAKA